MPETERKLVLHSPASSEHVEYRWPLSRTVENLLKRVDCVYEYEYKFGSD